MRGRYTNKATDKEIANDFKVIIGQDRLFEPRYNIAPTQFVPVILETKGERIINQLN